MHIITAVCQASPYSTLNNRRQNRKICPHRCIRTRTLGVTNERIVLQLLFFFIQSDVVVCDRAFLEQSMPIERRSGQACAKCQRRWKIAKSEEAKMSISGTTRTNRTRPRGIKVLTKSF